MKRSLHTAAFVGMLALSFTSCMTIIESNKADITLIGPTDEPVNINTVSDTFCMRSLPATIKVLKDDLNKPISVESESFLYAPVIPGRKVNGWAIAQAFSPLPGAIGLLVDGVTGAIYKPKIFGTPRIDGYFREAPFDGNLAAGFYVFNNAYRTIFHPEASKGVIGAYLMKWTMDGVLRPIKDDSGRKTKVSFQIVEGDEPRTFEDSCEQELFDMVRTASGANLILEDKELETWAKLNYKSFLPWKESVDMTGFSNTLLFSESRTPEAGQEEARRIIQFRNFLNDFTLVAEREVPEVGLWKNYLVFATLFGLAEKVSEAMKKLYPADFEKFSNETIGVNSSYMYNLLWFSSRIGSDAFSNAESAKAAAEAKARGGGGGRTSFGGGGGFSGGGFGGGSR